MTTTELDATILAACRGGALRWRLLVYLHGCGVELLADVEASCARLAAAGRLKTIPSQRGAILLAVDSKSEER